MRPFFATVALSVRRTFTEHVPLYVCAVVFCAVSWAVTSYYRVPMSLGASVFFLKTVPDFVLLGLGLFGARHFWRLFRQGADRPFAEMARWLRDGFLAGDRPGNVVHGLLALTPLMLSFNALKSDIPLIVPFSWDATFMRWDNVLGMGHAPWTWLQPVLGHPPVTAAINLVYDGWFLVMFGSLIALAFAAQRGLLRMQFLLAFAFSWFFAGNVLALIFSSAGPCYYALLHLPNDPYTEQMRYLRDAALHWPVWSRGVQDSLWRLSSGGDSAAGGSSAMPSMHVTIAVVVMMLGWRTSRTWGWALSAFALIIVIGAVHLAWHYFVDTIAGAALGLAFWFAAGWIVRRYHAWLDARRAGPMSGLVPQTAG